MYNYSVGGLWYCILSEYVGIVVVLLVVDVEVFYQPYLGFGVFLYFVDWWLVPFSVSKLEEFCKSIN